MSVIWGFPGSPAPGGIRYQGKSGVGKGEARVLGDAGLVGAVVCRQGSRLRFLRMVGICSWCEHTSIQINRTTFDLFLRDAQPVGFYRLYRHLPRGSL